MAPGLAMPPPAVAVPRKKSAGVAYAVPASAFDAPLVQAVRAETPAERTERKAAKAARKAAKAAKSAGAGGGEAAAAPEKKRKREAAAADDAEPSAAAEERAAKAARATPRVSNAEYRATHEIKVRARRSAAAAPQRRSRRVARR